MNRRRRRKRGKRKGKKREEEREKFENLVLNEKEEVQTPNIRIDDPLLEETGYILADLIILKKVD